jgi:hypothetical protein
MLTRGIELKDAYHELHDKLHAYPRALDVFLELVLDTATFWNPKELQVARSARSDLENTNRLIAKKAGELALLLTQRFELHNTSGFSSDTYYHVCDVLIGACQDNYLFRSYVRDKLEALSGQFDLKYWPTLSDFLQEVASDAENAVIEATDPLTAVATTAARPSKADYFKALFTAIAENSADNFGPLPRGFRLTDGTLASLVNCALDLGIEDLVDEAYVKRLRQRERSRNK